MLLLSVLIEVYVEYNTFAAVMYILKIFLIARTCL